MPFPILRPRHALVGACLMTSGCATLPSDPAQRGLYSDLRQVVETRERVGWIMDEHEMEEAMPSALQSVCQTEVETRIGLLDWFDERVAEEGGPAEQAYLEADKDKDAVEEILTLERMRDLLEQADAVSEEKCPFWLDPDPEFTGVQTDTHRFIFLAESGGGGGILLQEGEALFAGSGGLRLMPGYGFSDRIGLFLGIEAGAAGAISQASDGDGQEVVARPAAAIPLVFRVHDDTWLYDVELAAVTQYHEGELRTPGFRVSPAVGIGSVRIAGFMPYALALVAYDFFPESRGLPLAHQFRIGTRVGINFDP